MKEDLFPLDWHKAVMASPARFKVIVAHRKAWKTLLNIKQIDRWAMKVPGVYWLAFPSMAQGKRIAWDDPDMMARNVLPDAWNKRNKTDHYIEYPNGSKFYIVGAKDPDSLRGPNPMGVILDEYDDMDPSIWSAIVRPIMTANPLAWCWFTGTYKGRKDLWAKMQFAKITPNWFGLELKASESGIIDATSLAEAKAETPQAFFDMEYENVPVDGGLSFFTRVRENIWDGNFGTTDGKVFDLGIDVASVMDFTVITPIDVSDKVGTWGGGDKFMAGTPERFNQVDWPLIQARVEAAWGRYNRARVKLDSTGVGKVLTDYLQDRIKPFEPFTFTEQSRKDLLNNLSLMIANDKLGIPNYEPLLDELDSMSYELTKNGRVTIAVPPGQHDDCVMSLALAAWKLKKRKPVTSYQTQNFKDLTDEMWNEG